MFSDPLQYRGSHSRLRLKEVVVVAQVVRHGLSQDGDKIDVGGIPHDFEVRSLSLPPAAFVEAIPREVVVHDVHRIARLLNLRGVCEYGEIMARTC